MVENAGTLAGVLVIDGSTPSTIGVGTPVFDLVASKHSPPSELRKLHWIVLVVPNFSIHPEAEATIVRVAAGGMVSKGRNGHLSVHNLFGLAKKTGHSSLTCRYKGCEYR